MKKMLALLGSIGLTSTAASAVIACGEGNNTSVGNNKNIVVSKTSNGSYDTSTQTFSSEWGSDLYQEHLMSFSLKRITLKTANIQVATSTGVKLDQSSGLWSFKNSGKDTIFEIKDSSLNGATIAINSPHYAPITFKIAIKQIGDIIIDNVSNGFYQSATNTFVASHNNSQYEANKMSFTLLGTTLTNDGVQVTTSDHKITTGISLETKDGNTIITIDDYHLNGATFQLKDGDTWWPITFKVVIGEDDYITVNSEIRNGSYDSVSQTFTASYGSSRYSDNHMIFSLKNVPLTAQNIVVKDSSGMVVNKTDESWDFWTAGDGSSAVVEIKDWNLNGATIAIKDVVGYWPKTFKVVIIQDKHLVIGNITNGSYDANRKTLTATSRSSQYEENKMSFTIKDFSLDQKFILLRDENADQVNVNHGWSFSHKGNDTVVSIDDYRLNNAKLFIWNVDGYWNEIFTIFIPQDEIITPDVVNGSYDQNSQTLTANYGFNEYPNNKMSVALNGVRLTSDNVVVTTSDGSNTTIGRTLTNSQETTTITIDDYHLNGATIAIKGVVGYRPITFKLHIGKEIIVNPEVDNGSYDGASQTFTSGYGNVYNPLIFSLASVVVKNEQILVKDAQSNVVDSTNGRWDLRISEGNTVIRIDDPNLNGATLEIHDLDDHWPITFKFVIKKQVVVNPGVANGSYDSAIQTFISDHSDTYNPLTFSLANVLLENKEILVKDAQGNVVDSTTDRWKLWYAGDNGINTNTVIQIDDVNLDGATLEIHDLDGYLPTTFKFSLKKQVVVNDGVVNGSYDAATQTFTRTQDKYLVFSLKGIHLYPKDLVVLDNNAHIIKTSQNPELWKLWYAGDNEDNTVIQFNVDSSWTSALLSINLAGYQPIIFKIIIS